MKFFGLPIIAAVVAGIIFPYAALSLMPLGFVFLFLLMLFSGLSIDWHKLPAALKKPGDLVAGLVLVFAVYPLIQLFLARWLVGDAQLVEGVVFGALMPPALVAPFFTSQLDGDEEYSFLLMVISTLLVPFVAPVLLKVMTGSILPVRVVPLMNIMLLLVTVPLLCSFIIAKKLPRAKEFLKPYIGAGNAVALSLLIFILFGNAVGRLNIGYDGRDELVWLVVLAFFQDFGVLAITRLTIGRLFRVGVANALVVTLAMKNVAIATGVLLFYDPRASLAPALVFVAHACLFSFIPASRSFLKVREQVTSNR